MSRPDNYFVTRCLNGDREDYRHLVERYEGVLLSYLTGVLRHPARAEEAAQESFVRAYLALGTLKKRESFFPWLMGIAARVAKEECRRIRKANTIRPVEDLVDTSQAEAIPIESPVSRAIAELPAPCREVILLRYYGGLSSKEVGEALGKPLGTVTKTLSRAYALLRNKLPGERHSEGREVRK